MCEFSVDVAREAGFAIPVAVTPERGRRVDRLREYLSHADAYRRPADWPEYVAAAAASLVKRKVAVDFGPRGVRDAGEEGREEIASAIVCGIIAGDAIPEGISLARWLFRACRYARLRRGYIGGLAPETKRERHALDALDRGPYSGASMDARQPDPARVVAAIDSLDATGALWCYSGRQRAERVRVAKARGRTEYIIHRGPVAGSADHPYCQVEFERVRVIGVTYVGTRWHHGTMARTVPAVAAKTAHLPRPIRCTVSRPALVNVPLLGHQRMPVPWALLIPVWRERRATRVAWLEAADAARVALMPRFSRERPGRRLPLPGVTLPVGAYCPWAVGCDRSTSTY